MHQPTNDIRARFTFKPEHADHFLSDGQTVTEMEYLDMEELTSYINEFEDSIADVQVLVDGTKVITLSDFTYDI